MSGSSSNMAGIIGAAGAYASLRALEATQATTPLYELLGNLVAIRQYFQKDDFRHDDLHKAERLGHFVQLMDAPNKTEFLRLRAAAPRIIFIGEYYDLVQGLEYDVLARNKGNPHIAAAIALLKQQELALRNKINAKFAHENASGQQKVKMDVSEIVRGVNEYFAMRLRAVQGEWESSGQIAIGKSTKELVNIRQRLGHWSELSDVFTTLDFRQWESKTPRGTFSVQYATAIARLKGHQWLSVCKDPEIIKIMGIAIAGLEGRLQQYEVILGQARDVVRNQPTATGNTLQEGSRLATVAWNTSATDSVRYPLSNEVALQDIPVQRERSASSLSI